MKKYGLIGRNIQESLSPELHNGWFKQFGIDATYELLEMQDFCLPEGYDGFNITSPFKKCLTDEPINTVCGDKFYNTDAQGFMNAAKIFGYDFSGKDVLILGKGSTGECLFNELTSQAKKLTWLSGRTHKDILSYYANKADIIINCTNREPSRCHIDINYKHLVKDSFGYEMLRQQAALSFEIWTGINPLKEVA